MVVEVVVEVGILPWVAPAVGWEAGWALAGPVVPLLVVLVVVFLIGLGMVPAQPVVLAVPMRLQPVALGDLAGTTQRATWR